MWPTLIELLPHLSRLVPLWDKFLSSKAANEKATEAAILALSDGVRTDLDQVTQAHASLYRQLQAHTAQIAALGEEMRLAREAAERAEAAARVPDPELVAAVNTIKRLLVVVLGLIVMIFTILLVRWR